MAMTVSASIQLNDLMSGPIQSINNVLNTMLAGLASVDTATDTAFSASQITSMQNELAEVDVQIAEIVEQTKREKEAQDKVNASAQAGLPIFENLKSKITAMAGAYLGIQGIRKGIDFYKESIEGANTQIEAERKLETVMRQRMGATEAQIDMIKQLASAQQEIGVVGDEVQIGGAQQLSTFLNSPDALSTLMPAMNNLAVQQNGVDVTTENMVSIGNMMGKVMQGQTSALTRVGITFTEAQKKALEYGNEIERATTLAQVITDNVGEMNAAIAATPAGQIQQISNTWGDMKEVIGMQLYPAVMNLFDIINENLPDVMPILQGVTTVIGWVIKVLGFLADKIEKITRVIHDNWDIIKPILLGVVSALVSIKIATMVATASQWAFNASLYACPIVWIIGLIAAWVVAMYYLSEALGKYFGIAQTGFGVLCGEFTLLKQVVVYTGQEIANIFIGIWEVIKTLCRNIERSFKNSLSNLKATFYSFGSMALEVIGWVAEQLNKLPFVKFDYEGIITKADEWADIAAKEKGINYKYASLSDAFKIGASTYDTFPIGWEVEAFKKGAVWGDNKVKEVENTIRNFLGLSGNNDEYDKMMKDLMDAMNNTLSDNVPFDLSDSTDETAKNTKKIADNTEKTNNLFDLVRENLERKAIAEYTANTKVQTVDLSGMTNTYYNTNDAFDMVKELGRYLNQKHSTSAEGV